MSSPIVWNDAEYFRVFQSIDGPVGRDLVRRCRTLEVRAISHAGFDTGELISSIDSVFFTGASRDLHARTGVNPAGDTIGYGFWHHNGTKPHMIRPVRAKMLRFPNRKQGGFIFAHSVYHPGTSPNRYLTDHLPEAVS